MKVNRKTLIVSFVAVFFILLCCYFYLPWSKTGVIREFNKNTNLPFPLAISENNLEYGNEYQYVYGMGGYGLRKEGLFISVAGWPDDLGDNHLIGYSWTSADYSIFGFSIGDDYDNAVSLLKRYGYRPNEAGKFPNAYAKNNAIVIWVSESIDNSIKEIRVRAVSTNKRNVVF